jgi:site-specific recombinase XerD
MHPPHTWATHQRERVEEAHIEKPSLHDFRRAFAINFLRNGGDIYSLQNLMGHADLQVLRRYLAQTKEDLQIAHHNFSPVDNSRL